MRAQRRRAYGELLGTGNDPNPTGASVSASTDILSAGSSDNPAAARKKKASSASKPLYPDSNGTSHTGGAAIKKKTASKKATKNVTAEGVDNTRGDQSDKFNRGCCSPIRRSRICTLLKVLSLRLRTRRALFLLLSIAITAATVALHLGLPKQASILSVFHVDNVNNQNDPERDDRISAPAKSRMGEQTDPFKNPVGLAAESLPINEGPGRASNSRDSVGTDALTGSGEQFHLPNHLAKEDVERKTDSTEGRDALEAVTGVGQDLPLKSVVEGAKNEMGVGMASAQNTDAGGRIPGAEDTRTGDTVSLGLTHDGSAKVPSEDTGSTRHLDMESFDHYSEEDPLNFDSAGLDADLSSAALLHASSQTRVNRFHNVMEIWTIDTQNSFRGTPICRFHSVCRTKGGKLLLPSSLKHLVDKIEQCGIVDPAFVLPSAPMKLPRALSFQDGLIHLRFDTEVLDLLHFPSPRPSLERFLLDLMGVLFSLEVTNGYPGVLHQYECANATKSCKSRVSYKNVLPAIYLNTSLLALKEDKESWEGNLLESLKHSEGVGMSYLDEEKLHGDQPKAACFHSAIASKLEAVELPPGILDSDEALFLKDTSFLASPTVSHSIKNRERTSGSCLITFTIIAKREDRELRPAYKLKQTTLSMGEQAIKSALPNVDVKVVAQIVQFETNSFHKMVLAMRATDVLIAPHFPGLANSIFLHSGASVIEVFPFGFMSGTYEAIDLMKGIGHFSVVAKPQSKSFKQCIASEASSEQVQEIVREWDIAAEKYDAGALHTLRWEEPDAPPAAVRCALRQVLDFEVDEVARRAAEEGVKRCRYLSES